MIKSDEKRDEILRRMLKTPSKPHKETKKRKKPSEPMPTDDPEALVEWGKRNIQSDK